MHHFLVCGPQPQVDQIEKGAHHSWLQMMRGDKFQLDLVGTTLYDIVNHRATSAQLNWTL
jgi:hypothetical protein